MTPEKSTVALVGAPMVRNTMRGTDEFPSIDTEQLRQQVEAFRDAFAPLFEEGGRFPLKTATVSLTVTAAGTLGIPIAGVTLSAAGAIVLTFERP